MGKNFSLNTNKARPKNDFYQTPYSMTRHLLDREKFEGKIFEPCCGEGAILKVLDEYNYEYSCGDITFALNFLENFSQNDNIITNPPYSLAKEFILHAKKHTSKKIAMLLPLNYLHGIQRYREVWLDTEFPLKKIYVFCRYPMLSNEIREDGKYETGMMVYAWFIWDRAHKGSATIDWIDNSDDIVKK